MKPLSVHTLIRLSLLGAMLASLQACSVSPTPANDVSEAYQTSDAIAIKPYTRTIFSSNNF